MKVVTVKSIKISKLGGTVEINSNPQATWYFVPGAVFRVGRGRATSKILFPGYHSVEAMVELIESAPTIGKIEIDWDSAVTDITNYVKRRNLKGKVVSRLKPVPTTKADLKLDLTLKLQRKGRRQSTNFDTLVSEDRTP